MYPKRNKSFIIIKAGSIVFHGYSTFVHLMFNIMVKYKKTQFVDIWFYEI